MQNNDFSIALQTLEREMQRLNTELDTDEAKEGALKIEIPRLKQEIQALKKELDEKDRELRDDEKAVSPLHLKIQKIEMDLKNKHREFDQAKLRMMQSAQSPKSKLR